MCTSFLFSAAVVVSREKEKLALQELNNRFVLDDNSATCNENQLLAFCLSSVIELIEHSSSDIGWTIKKGYLVF